ncbi:sugar transferase [Accumulibacter sp.]|uniref:sugar transferase n=1 Tax=Accumulibacter sp. TaxID=2053492 RepID=UPI0025FB244B|nr:sugar transferase [Accumulibacter sp.]MCP5229434.1 sugar transferase [Accumulibacter sp.]
MNPPTKKRTRLDPHDGVASSAATLTNAPPQERQRSGPGGLFENPAAARMTPPLRKRLFDLSLCLLTAPVWLVALLVCTIVQLLFEGRPIFYVSVRRVWGKEQARVLKFRTMVRDAEKIYNRATVPVSDKRFLNTPIDSPMYTRVGRLIERCQFTELPQVLQVITGTLTIVGNRPLPENVIAALKERYPNTEARFATPSGLTGLPQLVGRDSLEDADRLALETRYCHIVGSHYAASMDFQILLFTVLIQLRLMKPLTVEDAQCFLAKFGPQAICRAADV